MKKIKENNKSKRFFVKIMIFIIIFIFLIFMYASYVGIKGLKINEIKIINSNINDNYYGYKIVQISDIHYKQNQKKELNTVINEINKYKPNIVVITGDLLIRNNSYNENDIEYLTNSLNKINSKYKYIILGNEDDYDIISTISNNSNFKLLDNKYELIYDNSYNPIFISGLNSKHNHEEYEQYITIFNKAIIENKSVFNILLIHEPSMIEKIDYTNFNLILSGHTINGNINIPLIKKLFMDKSDSKYTKSHYTYNNTDFYISNGIGVSKYKLRLFNTPSINVYRLLNK